MHDTLGYLLAQICKAHRNQVNDALTDLDLHVGQEMILLRLWQGDGLTQSDLADTLCLQPATVTRMLTRMARAGLLTRGPDTHDQRVSRVYLTERGRAMQQPVLALWQTVEERMTRHFTVEERLLLRRLLLQLQNNLTDARDSTGQK